MAKCVRYNESRFLYIMVFYHMFYYCWGEEHRSLYQRLRELLLYN